MRTAAIALVIILGSLFVAGFLHEYKEKQKRKASLGYTHTSALSAYDSLSAGAVFGGYDSATYKIIWYWPTLKLDGSPGYGTLDTTGKVWATGGKAQGTTKKARVSKPRHATGLIFDAAAYDKLPRFNPVQPGEYVTSTLGDTTHPGRLSFTDAGRLIDSVTIKLLWDSVGTLNRLVDSLYRLVQLGIPTPRLDPNVMYEMTMDEVRRARDANERDFNPWRFGDTIAILNHKIDSLEGREVVFKLKITGDSVLLPKDLKYDPTDSTIHFRPTPPVRRKDSVGVQGDTGRIPSHGYNRQTPGLPSFRWDYPTDHDRTLQDDYLNGLCNSCLHRPAGSFGPVTLEIRYQYPMMKSGRTAILPYVQLIQTPNDSIPASD